MSIKRYVSNKDTTITNAFKENLITRGVYANMGESDSLEVFSIYGQATTSSLEKSRILIDFPISSIIADRAAGTIPASGSVNFILKLFNVRHPFSVPRKFTLNVSAVSQSWEEGYGLDMEGYTDPGFGNDGYGANWLSCSANTAWTTEGGSITSSVYSSTQYFETGTEDLNLDVTPIVENWISGTIQKNGFLIYMSGAAEDGSSFSSYYTKKFSARGTEFYLKRPCVEAQWNPSSTDDRESFYASSDLLSSADNTMNLYFFNKVKGVPKNIVNSPTPSVKFYTNSSLTNEITASSIAVTNPLAGVYKAAVILNTTASTVYDKWFSGSVTFFTSSFDVLTRENYSYDNELEYVVNITNLKKAYNQTEQAKFKIFARLKDWSPTIYTVAYNITENTPINNLYYKIFRLEDNYTVIDYSTGSIAYSKTSYDSQGNYFDFDMNILQKDFTYAIKLATYDGSQIKEFNNTFKFKVE
jgi:hypothetical protein